MVLLHEIEMKVYHFLISVVFVDMAKKIEDFHLNFKIFFLYNLANVMLFLLEIHNFLLQYILIFPLYLFQRPKVIKTLFCATKSYPVRHSHVPIKWLNLKITSLS